MLSSLSPRSVHHLFLLFALLLCTTLFVRAQPTAEEEQPSAAVDVEKPADAMPLFAMAGENGRMLLAKRRVFGAALASILNKRSRDFGFNDYIRVQARSLDNKNCYFSPVQCYYLDERKRRSAPSSAEQMLKWD